MVIVSRCTLYRETETTSIFPYTCKSAIAPMGPTDSPGLTGSPWYRWVAFWYGSSVSRDEDNSSSNHPTGTITPIALKQHGLDLFFS